MAESPAEVKTIAPREEAGVLGYQQLTEGQREAAKKVCSLWNSEHSRACRLA